MMGKRKLQKQRIEKKIKDTLGDKASQEYRVLYDPQVDVFEIAYVVDSNETTAAEILSQVKDYIDDNLTKNKEVELAWKLFKNESTFQTYIQRFISSIPSGTVVTENKELRTICEWWIKNLGYRDLTYYNKPYAIPGLPPGVDAKIKEGATFFNVEGDWIVTEVWDEVTIDVGKKKKTVFIPIDLPTFSATTIDIPEAFSLLGYEIPIWHPPVLNTYDEEERKRLARIVKTFSPVLKQALQNREPVVLPLSNYMHFKRLGVSTLPYGISAARPLFAPYTFKKSLNALHLETARGLINELVIIAVGKIRPEHLDEDMLKALQRAKIMKQQLSNDRNRRGIRKTSAIKAITWPGDDINVVHTGPDGKILDFDRLYNTARSDIYEGLIHPILLSGNGRDFNEREVALAVMMFVNSIDYFMKFVEGYLTMKLEEIAEFNGYKNEPVYYRSNKNHLIKLALRYADSFRLWALNALSTESLLQDEGFDPALEHYRLKTEYLQKDDSVPDTPRFDKTFFQTAGLVLTPEEQVRPYIRPETEEEKAKKQAFIKKLLEGGE